MFLAEDELGPFGLTKSGSSPPPIAAATKSEDNPNSQMLTWQNRDPKALWGQVRDIRIFFVSGVLASQYLDTHQDFLSEGAPLESELTLDEIPIKAFGPRNKKATDLALSLGMPENTFTGYAFLFQFNNVVAKLFVLKGIQSDTRVSSRSYLPFVKAAIEKLRQACK